MANNLGKGLGALITMFDEDMEELSSQKEKPRARQSADTDKIVPRGTIDAPTTGVQEISIALIDNNISQPRRVFNADEMRELEQSIQTHGVLQPILLNK